jgi:hypothetical protein
VPRQGIEKEREKEKNDNGDNVTLAINNPASGKGIRTNKKKNYLKHPTRKAREI